MHILVWLVVYAVITAVVVIGKVGTLGTIILALFGFALAWKITNTPRRPKE